MTEIYLNGSGPRARLRHSASRPDVAVTAPIFVLEDPVQHSFAKIIVAIDRKMMKRFFDEG